MDTVINNTIVNGTTNYVVPKNVYGQMNLLVNGYDNNLKFIDSASVKILTNPNASVFYQLEEPDTIYIVNQSTYLLTGKGKTSDGYQTDIGSMPGIKFEIMDTNIATCFNKKYPHQITAKQIGITDLKITLGGQSDLYPVEVFAQDSSYFAMNAFISAYSDVSCNSVCNGYATATAQAGKSPYTFNWSTSPVQSSITATGLCPGDYTLTVIDAKLDTIQSTISIVQMSALTIDLPDTVNTCPLDSVNLKANPSGGTKYSFLWKPGKLVSDSTAASVKALPSVNTTFTVTVMDIAGCVAMHIVSVLLDTAVAKPTITQLGNQLSSSASVKNQWYLNGLILTGDTNKIITINKTGSYTVKTVGTDLCDNLSNPFLITGLWVGPSQPNFSSSPNPVDDQLRLTYSLESGGIVSISIYNQLGEQVSILIDKENQSQGNHELVVTLSSLPPGMYYLKQQAGEKMFSTKLVKQ